MSKISTIIISSLVIASVPFTGFPQSWKSFATFVLGLFVAIIAYSARKGRVEAKTAEQPSEKVYSENQTK